MKDEYEKARKDFEEDMGADSVGVQNARNMAGLFEEITKSPAELIKEIEEAG